MTKLQATAWLSHALCVPSQHTAKKTKKVHATITTDLTQKVETIIIIITIIIIAHQHKAAGMKTSIDIQNYRCNGNLLCDHVYEIVNKKFFSTKMN